MTHNGVDLFILAIIPLMAITATVIVWAVMRYVLRWTYVNDPLYLTLLFGQLLDASATSYGIDLHPSVQYVEQHVVGSALIDMTGTAFVMFPLKLLVLFPAVYVMQMLPQRGQPRVLAPRAACDDRCRVCTGCPGHGPDGTVCLIPR